MLYMKENFLRQYQDMILPGPLNGKVVLGFCYYVAGPIALQSLVEQGALVIKLEQKSAGDPSRKVFSSAIFNTLARGQLSVSLDIKNQEDQELIRQLFDIADIILDNRSVRAKGNDQFLTNFLEDPDKISPVIYCSIDGFPNAAANTMPGLDASVQACTGMAYSNCFNPDQPLKVGVPVLDIATGLLAANNILANLGLLISPLPDEAKNVIKISTSLAGTSVWMQGNQFLDALADNEYLRTGNQDRYAAPFSYYTAKDGLISVATVNETQFQKFCIYVLENPKFHERYPTIRKRIQDQDNFECDLNALLKNKKIDYWLAKCSEYNIPVAPVLTVSQALEQEFVQLLVKSSRDGELYISNGITNSLFKNIKPRSAPELGQDNEDVRLALTRDIKTDACITSTNAEYN